MGASLCHVTGFVDNYRGAKFGEFSRIKCNLIRQPVSCNTTKLTLYGELSAVRTLRFLVSTRPAAPACRVDTIPSHVIQAGAAASAATRTAAPNKEGAASPASVLLSLLGIYALGTVSLQGFNLVYLRVAADIGAGDASGLITAIPGIVLGVACFLYGTLGDFIPLRRIVDVGVALIVAGSLLGFAFSSSLTGIIIARALQTLGYQAAASAYMILATGIADPKRRGLYVGLMCAAFQGGTAIGMLSGGLLADANWALLLLIPLGGLAFVPAPTPGALTSSASRSSPPWHSCSHWPPPTPAGGSSVASSSAPPPSGATSAAPARPSSPAPSSPTSPGRAPSASSSSSTA